MCEGNRGEEGNQLERTKVSGRGKGSAGEGIKEEEEISRMAGGSAEDH